MDFRSSQEPPVKKRRFFHEQGEQASSDPIAFSPRDDSPQVHKERSLRDEIDGEPENRQVLVERSANETPRRVRTQPPAQLQHESSFVTFDKDTFEAFVGANVSSDVISIIQAHCGGNLERAVNMYFDGTYKKLQKPSSLGSLTRPQPSSRNSPTTTPNSETPPPTRQDVPKERYLGAFGAEGWATCSGTNLLKHGDIVKIERQVAQTSAAKSKSRQIQARKTDVLVRFTTQQGREIGRLQRDTSAWVSVLIDQKLCRFDAVCVYAPDRLRTNETVFLQLKCYFLNSAFQRRGFKLADDRSTRPFEQEETTDEKNLRLRQTAMVRLFQEVNLQPTVANEKASEGRKGLLKAAEMDEKKQKEAQKAERPSDSTPPSEEEGQELEQDQLDALYKKAQSFDFNTPEAEPADTFAMTLRTYQKQALHWMMAKEKDERSSREPSMHPLWEEYVWPTKDVDDNDLPLFNGQEKFYVNPYSGDLTLDFPEQEQHCLGGILADEMGLGKTIQMLSLIHSHRSEVARQASLAGISDVNQLPRLGANASGVLDAPCTTLVIAPMSLLAQWQSESEKASKVGTMKIELYYGAEKSNNLQSLCAAGNASRAPDIVITSYGIVLSEFSAIAARDGDKSWHKGIFSLKFFRVILDEAHHIKNRASKTAKACYDIPASHRWVLTGTPIVNRLEDLFSMVRFLGVEPWNNFSFWRTFITVPFESGEFVRALDVVQTVLEPLVMRRTKDMKTPTGEPLVPLPLKQIDVVEIELSETERGVYDHIFTRAKRTFSQNLEAGTVFKAYTTIFAQLLRLRQSCCHPMLVRNREIAAEEEDVNAAADAAAGLADDMDLDALLSHFTVAVEEASKDSNQTFGAHALKEIRDESEKECPLCFEEPMNDQLVTGCWHSACKKCILDYMRHETDRGEVPKCFNCREPLDKRDLFEVVRNEDDIDPETHKPRISLQRLGANTSSAKIVALLSHLRALRKEHPQMKSVIFSQFTSFLSLIEPVLTRANIKFLRLDGSMAQKARAAVLREFAEGQGFTVLLLSLRAGGVGLNLTSAGRVFMMDPWWSFAVEAQAIDRVHRMGQESEVFVKRFVVKGSVEERMLRVQERKKFIATSLGMMSDEEKKMQRIEDIKELLS
ncbi:SNF2 superfamily RAD5 protein [Emericellopsis cladophorae]|uniref:SNF2 superfamily RAD5 protein n=1 Tax=Emericellopsis cladophorae TaxID=2686198 RepID=A0A9P9XYL8_9HYPO|nr:SNF2 superfamily RAD5 protein [Emericellopsis cladophorae]KAI6780100.1 SNF2 superfamily RAD5 protein [Emericellopsis cladophorae]